MRFAKKPIAPNFRTGEKDFSKVELAKLASEGLRFPLGDELRKLDCEWLEDAAEQIAKSHGIYLEFNRETRKENKEWIYMVRVSIPGGGPLDARQWAILDDLAEKYAIGPDGRPSLRTTTRQNVQFHWVRKANVIELVREVARSGFFSLNGCGDNVRNVMGCPFSAGSTLFDANALAQELGLYFRLEAEPHLEVFEIDPGFIRTPDERFHYAGNLLNRKFKIAVSALHLSEDGDAAAENCVEVRTNDAGVTPLFEGGKVDRLLIWAGGGQGEKNLKPTYAALAQPLGVVPREKVIAALDAIVSVHQEWGDRQNRHWARLKYLVNAYGIQWLRDQVRGRGIGLADPPDLPDPGPRHLHHGWLWKPEENGWTFGAFIENGRLIDGPDQRLKSMVRALMEKYPVKLWITPNQDLLFRGIDESAREEFEADLTRFGHGRRHGQACSELRKRSVACVGLLTCRLAYTDSERFLPELLDELESRGWGALAESVGVSGCERQCSRPSTKAIGWVGSGANQYQLRLMGSEDGRHQGGPILDSEGQIFLLKVPRAQVADVTEVVFQFHSANAGKGEDLGTFCRRQGMERMIELFRTHPKTMTLMERSFLSLL